MLIMMTLIRIVKKVLVTERARENKVLASAWPASESSCEDLLVLVDKKTPIPESYVPQDLVLLSSYGIPTLLKGTRLRRVAADSLVQLVVAATAAGENLVVASAYRSFEEQKIIFDRLTFTYEEGAGAVCARPGHSQHQLGTAVDFTNEEVIRRTWLPFGNTSASRWLMEHGEEYGFVLAYPRDKEVETGYQWEPWHYRYIGVENVRHLQASDLSLQDFLLQEGILPA